MAASIVFEVDPAEIYPPDFIEWVSLSYAERMAQTAQLWDIYKVYGGSFESDLDTQSPWFNPEASAESAVNGGAGVRLVRRC